MCPRRGDRSSCARYKATHPAAGCGDWPLELCPGGYATAACDLAGLPRHAQHRADALRRPRRTVPPPRLRHRDRRQHRRSASDSGARWAVTPSSTTTAGALSRSRAIEPARWVRRCARETKETIDEEEDRRGRPGDDHCGGGRAAAGRQAGGLRQRADGIRVVRDGGPFFGDEHFSSQPEPKAGRTEAKVPAVPLHSSVPHPAGDGLACVSLPAGSGGGGPGRFLAGAVGVTVPFDAQVDLGVQEEVQHRAPRLGLLDEPRRASAGARRWTRRRAPARYGSAGARSGCPPGPGCRW